MRRFYWFSWLVLAIWLVVCLATLDYNGPFYDEGIYLTAGVRTLQGHGLEDGYLRWFAGSLLWPQMAGAAFRLGGLLAVRALAALFAAAAFLGVVQAARNLFGQRAAFWTALSFALSGPLLALARLGVYDLPALAGIGLAFWGVTETVKRDNRLWLILAALSYTLAVFSKYPLGLMLLPLAAVLIVSRKRKAALDLGLFGFVVGGLTLAFYMPARPELGALVEVLAPKLTFEATPAMVWYTVFYFTLAPLCLCLLGWLAARDQRPLATVLLLTMFIWPAYHIYAGYLLGLSKHVVFGFLFAYPLIGLALDTLWRKWSRPAAVLVSILFLAALGYTQWQQLSMAWPDVRPTTAFLFEHMAPGDRVLSNESWPYTCCLYDQGLIESPRSVADVYDVYTRPEQVGDLCQYDWFVDSAFYPRWPPDVRDTVLNCGTYTPVHIDTRMVIGLTQDLEYVTYPVEIRVWHNDAMDR